MGRIAAGVLTLAVILGACTGHTLPADSLLQDEEKMINILVDMHIAEAAIGRQNIIFRDSLRGHYRDNILLIHDIAESEYDTVIWQIQQDVNKYRVIQEKVYQRLKTLKDSTQLKSNVKS